MSEGQQQGPDGGTFYPGGVPNPERVGFITLGGFGHAPDFSQAIQDCCRALGRLPHFIDEDGYEHEVIAAALMPENERLGWVEYRSKDINGFVDIAFHLRARVRGKLVIEWEVETYNPYFGCQVEYLAWHGERIVVIYHEKHSTYACSLAPGAPVTRIRLADEWLLNDDVLLSRSEVPDQIDRHRLPGLDALEPMAADEAWEAGLLPPGFDRANELNSRYTSQHGWKRRDGGYSP
jgi:hypothetical protein